MTKLNQTARETIKWDYRGLTIAGYTRHYFGDAGWGGDRCGCVDDRCIGYHHDGEEGCKCLPSWLDDYYAATRAPAKPVLLDVSRDQAEHPRDETGKYV